MRIPRFKSFPPGKYLGYQFLQITFCRVLPRIQGTPIETDGTSQKFVGTSVRTVLIEIYYTGLKVVIFQLAISQTELRTLIGQNGKATINFTKRSSFELNEGLSFLENSLSFL